MKAVNSTEIFSPPGYIKSFSDEEFCLEILSFIRDFLSTLIKPLFSLEDENYRCIKKDKLKKKKIMKKIPTNKKMRGGEPCNS